MAIRALVFDFDGLIIDTERAVYQAWESVLDARGIELPMSAYQRTIGASEVGLLAYLADADPTFRYQDAAEEIERLCRDFSSEQPALPGVEDYISEAQGIGLKLAIASSSTREWVVGHLTRLGLFGCWDALAFGDEVSAVKPDPGVYLSVLHHLNLAGVEAIALEDSPNGIKAARAAGLRCVAVPNPLTANLDFTQADLTISSLTNLPLHDLISRLGQL